MNTKRIKKGSMAFILLVAFLPSPMFASPLLSLIHGDKGNENCQSSSESWRKYDINADGKFDSGDINELINRGGQEISFDLNHDGKKDMDDALALFLKLSVLDRSCNGEVDDSDYEPVDPISLPEAPDIQTVRRLVLAMVSKARINLPFDIEDQAFRAVPPDEVMTLADRAYLYQIAGLSGLAQRNLDAAIWGFGRSFQTDETSPGAIGSLGFCMAASDKDDEALLLLAYARELFPESAATATSLGWMFARHGQNDEALEYLRQAVANTPEIAQYHMNLGVLLMRMGREREAFEEFREAAERDPDDPGKFLFFYATKPPEEPPVKKPLDPEEFRKARDIEIGEMQELGYSEEELPEPWDQMSPCDQATTIPEILERKNAARMEEIARQYANDAASRIDELIKGYWPKWKNITEDWNRYVDGVQVISRLGPVIMKNAEKMAGNESASLTREAGAELLGYSSFFMESAIRQAESDAREAVKRFSHAPLSAKALVELKAEAYKDALKNAMEYCYKRQIDQAYRWMAAEGTTYGLPNPTIEALTTENFFMLFLVIPQRCFDIKGYCPDGEGADAKEPNVEYSNTVGIDLFIIKIEWNPATDEFELNLGQGVMVGMTWKPETGFGVQVGLGFHGSAGFMSGEAAVWARLDEGILTIETEMENSLGVGPINYGKEKCVTQAAFSIYNGEIFL